MRAIRIATLAILATAFLCVLPAWADQPADSPRPPKLKLSLTSTPLQDETDRQIEERKKKNQTLNADCDGAVKEKRDNDIVKHCKVPKVSKSVAVPKEIKGADKKVHGIRVETQTTYECESAEHCGMSEWPSFAVKPEDLDKDGGDPVGNAAALHVRRSLTVNSSAVNNDLDCTDTLTGEHLGGYMKDDAGHPIIGQTYPNGHEKSCFDYDGAVKRNLVVITDGCQHPNGTTFETAECEARNYTTLTESKDEDPPAAAGMPAYDRDGDGVSGEDGPDAPAGTSRCEQKGGVLLADNSCDFGRKVRLDYNGRAHQNGKKGWKINAAGDCDPTAEGDTECGQEARRVTRNEWYALRCPENAEYIDGRCLVPTTPEEFAVMSESGAVIAPERNLLTIADGTAPVADEYALMGFTWALPKVEWGIDESQEACILGFCFEVFALRFGYDFDLAFGLRLPVKVEVTTPEGTAVTSATAEQEKNYIAKLTPVDFTAKQYKEFCVKHHLAEKGKISDCDRFSFPEYYWSQIVGLFSPDSVQGSEFVAQAVVWAGLELRLLSIPVVDWSVGVDMNLPAMCTMWKVYDMQVNPIGLVVDLAKGGEWLTAVEEAMRNCGTFVTPFGYKVSATNPSEKILRVFPFLSGRFTIDADCTIAKAKGWVASLGGKQIPLCTHLSYYGVGIGLRFTAAAASTHISADWSATGDAYTANASTLDFKDLEATGPNTPAIGPVLFDNYGTGDDGKINLSNFKYYLDTLQFGIEAVVQILNYGVVGIPVYSMEFEGLDLIHLNQHPGTDPWTITIPVKNYGLTVHAGPSAADPKRVNENTLKITPGQFGYFDVAVRNEGSVPDSFSHFASELPASTWSATPDKTALYAQSIAAVPAHAMSSNSIRVGVQPYLHPLTAPGIYPVKFRVDSSGAIAAGMAETDASGIKRLGAEGTAYVQVEAFYDPRLALILPQATVRPGEQASFTAGITNFGNDEDSPQLARTFLDSNRSACTLTTLGSIPAGENSGCPYRAIVTMIPAAEWTTVSSLPTQFGPLLPLGKQEGKFSVTAPRDWAGMQDTTYQIAFSSQSLKNPVVHNDVTLNVKVLATKESMIRYISAELTEFLNALNTAAAQGIRARGAEPVTVHPISMMVNKALEQAVSGQSDSASKTLASAGKVMSAVQRMVGGANIPEPFASDWKARTAAMVADLATAERQ